MAVVCPRRMGELLLCPRLPTRLALAFVRLHGGNASSTYCFSAFLRASKTFCKSAQTVLGD